MDHNLIAIGKMAELNHVSIATLRLYDELGLVKPCFVDPETKYRYYSIGQNARLDMIAYMKDLGMSLKEIKDVLKKENIDEIEGILSLKKEQIYQEIRKLKTRLHFVDDSISKIERYRNSPKTGICSLEYISQRYVHGIECPYDFYKDGIAEYEKDLMILRNHLLNLGQEQIYSYNIGTSIKKDDFIKGINKTDRIFIFSDYKVESLEMKKIEASMFAAIYASSFDEEIVFIPKLREFCKENGYVIAGDYICEVITEFNVFQSDKRAMFLRLQVPVKFNA